MTLRSLTLTAALTLAACRAAPSEPVDAGAPSSLADAAALPEPPFQLTLTLRGVLPDGGTSEVELGTSAPPIVAPAERLEVLANAALKDYRIRLFDDADRALISDDAPEELAEETRYLISLTAPLKQGHRYTLVLDSQSGAAIADTHGRTHRDRRLPFIVSGEKEKEKSSPAPGRGGAKSKKRRRR